MPAERHPLWSRLPPVLEPTAEQLARVQRAVEERARAQRMRRRLRLVPGLLLGLGLLWWLLHERVPTPETIQSRAPVMDTESRTGEGVPSAPAPLVMPPASSPTVPVRTSRAPAAPATLRDRMPARSMADLGRAPASSPPAAALPSTPPSSAGSTGSTDDAEAALLGRAISRLRHGHDPQGALALLENYREQFPRGALRSEAMLVQAESLARLGRHKELVAMLDPDKLTELPRSTELRLLRAEALANLDRCGEAILVFNDILAPGEEDAPAVEARLRERALYGRALCRARNGQIAAARRDLELVQDEFPDETDKVRQTLQSLAGRP